MASRAAPIIAITVTEVSKPGSPEELLPPDVVVAVDADGLVSDDSDVVDGVSVDLECPVVILVASSSALCSFVVETDVKFVDSVNFSLLVVLSLNLLSDIVLVLVGGFVVVVVVSCFAVVVAVGGLVVVVAVGCFAVVVVVRSFSSVVVYCFNSVVVVSKGDSAVAAPLSGLVVPRMRNVAHATTNIRKIISSTFGFPAMHLTSLLKGDKFILSLWRLVLIRPGMIQ